MTAAELKRLAANVTRADQRSDRARKRLLYGLRSFLEVRGNGAVLVKATGLSRAHLSDVRHGRRLMSVGMVEKLGGMK